MAYQPEVVSYDAGVYQLEVIDPVDGGVGAVSNKPLLNLANRTAYLYQHVTNLENGTTIPPTVAPLNNANLTGTPTAPTPALGDSSTKISTTAFVQGTVNGLASINVAGGSNVTLTSVQAGNGILVFTGALTANIAVIVPASAKTMVVENLTSGAFTLTVKTAAGTGVAVTQGKTQELICDGTNVLLSSSDFVNMALTGTSTAATPAVGDQSTKIATTNFVYQLTNGVVSVSVAGNSNVALSAAQYGNGIILLTGALTGSINVWVPAQGGTYIFANQTSGAFSVNIGVNGGGTKALVPQGQSVVAYCDGTNVVLAGAAASSSFTLYTFTATAGQTTFNCPYTPGNIAVIVNGAQIAPSNYTATNGSSVVLNTASALNDDIQIVVFASFTVANALTLAGGTMTGPIMHAGGDTGVTPAQFDKSTLLATTAALVRDRFGFSAFSYYNASSTLGAATLGSVIDCAAGAGAYTLTLPTLSASMAGSAIKFVSYSSSAVTVSSGSSVKIWLGTNGGASATSLTLQNGDTATLLTDGSAWYVVDGSALLPATSIFSASLATSGYQKLPSGLIIQWGQATSSTSAVAVVFPMAFPNNCLSATVTVWDTGSSSAWATANTLTKSQFLYSVWQSTSTRISNWVSFWIAVGY